MSLREQYVKAALALRFGPLGIYLVSLPVADGRPAWAWMTRVAKLSHPCPA